MTNSCRIALMCIMLLPAIGICQPGPISYCTGIRPLIDRRCGSCHRPGGYSALDFTQASVLTANARTIRYVVTKDQMPPWKAAPKYNCFINDRRLRPGEKDTLLQWIIQGAHTDSACAHSMATASSIDQLPPPDMVVRLPQRHTIRDDNQDEFITYVQPLGLHEDRYLSAIAIRPTNKALTHHIRVEMDTTDRYSSMAGPGGYFSTDLVPDGFAPSLPGVGFYVPGVHYIRMPDGLGIRLSPRMKVIISIHYAPSTRIEYDQTEVWLYFARRTADIRPAHAIALTLQDRSEYVPADSFSTITLTSAPLPSDISLFSIEPHMHLLGRSMRVTAILPSDSVIDLIDIPDWDFDWQEFYYYKKYIKLPKGTRFRAVSTFDNTTSNPRNPNYPPKRVGFAEMDTKNEMMGFLYQYTLYREGDEQRQLTGMMDSPVSAKKH